MTTIREYKHAFERQGWMTRQDAARTLRHVDGSNIEKLLDAANMPTICLPYEHGKKRTHSRMFWGPAVQRMALAMEARRIGLFDKATMRQTKKRITAKQVRAYQRAAQVGADIELLMGVK